MAYSYEQIGTVCATFSCPGNVTVGQVCNVVAYNTVGSCSDDSSFCGVVMNKRDGCAAVALQGFVTVPYTGIVPPAGYTPLAADGNGNVMVSSGSTPYLVVSVNTTAQTVTFLL